MIASGILSVSSLTRYVRKLLDSDGRLQDVWVRGEVFNFKHHTSGHVYFTLKDEAAALRCVMFRSYADGALRFRPRNGMKLIVHGYVSVYERDGQYQLYAQEIFPDGVGMLYVRYEELKRKLFEEGLFDESVKRKIPLLPRRVGLITSLSGAAIRDIITISRRRFPGIDMVVAPVKVQGDDAPRDMIRAIELMNRYGQVDVIILGRGGGSMEELWAFNSEELARAIRASNIPVVSAVGHEVDYTIADFAADLRAPTPSAAAERVIPERTALEGRLRAAAWSLQASLTGMSKAYRKRLSSAARSGVFRRPEQLVADRRQRLGELSRTLQLSLEGGLARHRRRLELLAGKLEALSPLAIMARGYSVCRRLPERRLVDSVRSVAPGDAVEVLLRDGRLDCRVERLEEEKRGDERSGQAGLRGSPRKA